MKGRRMKALLSRARKYSVMLSYPVAAILVVAVIWTGLVWAFKLPVYFLPAPLVIAEELFSVGFSLAPDALITIEETVLGFLLAIVAGFALAVLIVWSATIRRAVLPLLIFLQTMPKIAIAPLFIIWFGFGILPKIILSFMVCFFPIVINTSVGMTSVNKDMLDLINSMSATQGQILRKVRIPNALPYFFTSLKIAITLALIGAIVGEFIGGEAGLGYQILLANARLNAPKLFAIVFILMVIGAGLFYIISGLERFVLPWKAAEEEADTTMTGVY